MSEKRKGSSSLVSQSQMIQVYRRLLTNKVTKWVTSWPLTKLALRVSS